MPKHNQPLQIRLTEPVIFLKGPSTGLDFRGRPQTVRQDGQPAIVRGLLTLRLTKPTRIRSITIKLEGKARTEWPEGIGSKRMDTSEEHVILYDQTTFFSAYQQDEDDSRSRSARRALSVGPGVRTAHDDEDADDDLALRGTDDADDWLDIGRSRQARPRRQDMVRSSSAMPGTHDNHTWHRDGFSRRPSLTDLTPPPAIDLSNLSIAARGPSPAYTPTASPPRMAIPLPGGHPSRPSSLRQSSTHTPRDNLPSREPALSPIASAAPSQAPSERGNSAEAEHRRAAHAARGTLLTDPVQEGAEWSPHPSSSNLRDSALQDEDGGEHLGASNELRPIVGQRASHNSTGEVRFQDEVNQANENDEKDISTARRDSVQSESETTESPDNQLAPSSAAIPDSAATVDTPGSEAAASVPPPTPAPAVEGAPTSGARAASVRTMNSTFSASSASLSVDSQVDLTREHHPTGVQAISAANTPAPTAHNSPVSSAPPSIHHRSSTETLNTPARTPTAEGSSPNNSRRTSLLSNSARRSSEQNVPDLAARPSQDNLSRQGRTTRLGSTSTIVESPSILNNGSQANLPSSTLGQPRTQRTASGTPSISSGPSANNHSLSHLRVGSSSHRDSSEDSRGRKHSKFSLAATLRGLSREVKETFHHGHRAASKSRSRMSSPVRGAGDSIHSERHGSSIASSSMARIGSETNINGTARRAGSRNPSYRQDDFQPTFGRGGAGNRPGRSRERDASTVRGADSEERSRSRARGRHMGMKVLTDKLGIGESEDHNEDVHNWKEFRKGTYNYPISFPIPVNAPPTIHAEFGSVVYRMKATVIRVGALTSNLTEEMEVVMIATPQEDDMEESENVIVERQWEEQMRYQITLGGKAFPIAGTIPISIRLMPLLKCKIHRLTVALEEKTDYFAQERKVARHETPKRFVLLFIKQPDYKERIEPLLPIISDDPSAAENSPVAEMARQAVLNGPITEDMFDLERDPNDSMYASLMEPTGPWHLEKELHVPDCATKIKFTTKHDQTNITVGHWLKVTIRVERGDDEAMDSKGRRKQFDIIIETPIKLLDCRVNPQYNSLPTYSALSRNITAAAGICSVHGGKSSTSAPLVPKNRSQNDSAIAFGAAGSGSTSTPPRSPGPAPGLGAEAGPSSYIHAHASRRGTTDTLPNPVSTTPTGVPVNGTTTPSGHGHGFGHGHAVIQESGEDTLLERNIVYDRLMSGQVTETGETPPTYGEALASADAARTSRSVSRVRLRDDEEINGAVNGSLIGNGNGNGERSPSTGGGDLGGVPMGRGRSEASGRGRSRLRE